MRLQLLSEYGGTWIDSTIYCTGRKIEHIMSLPLFVFKGDLFATPLSNWFIVSDPHNPIIEMTRDLLFTYWKEHDRAIDYFMFHMFFRMSSEAYSDEYSKMPYMSNQPPKEMVRSRYNDYTEEKMKHFVEVSDFHKMTYKHEYGAPPSPSSIYQHILDSYAH